MGKMKTSTKVWIGVAVVVVILALMFMGYYNKFVTLDNGIQGQWSEVESQYQRQADLIPNIVSTVSSAVKVETNFVKEVTDLRASWQNSKTDEAGVALTNGAVNFVNAVAENYPTLQANKQYTQLVDELAGTQNRITTARGRYIEMIKAYNIAVQRFPGNMFAGLYGYSAKTYYQAEPGALETPDLGEGTLP